MDGNLSDTWRTARDGDKKRERKRGKRSSTQYTGGAIITGYRGGFFTNLAN